MVYKNYYCSALAAAAYFSGRRRFFFADYDATVAKNVAWRVLRSKITSISDTCKSMELSLAKKKHNKQTNVWTSLRKYVKYI